MGEFGKGLDSVISGKKVTMQVIQVFELKRGVMSGWCGVYLEICEICCIVFVGGRGKGILKKWGLFVNINN